MGKLEYCPLVGSGGCSKPDGDLRFQKDTFFLAEPFTPKDDRQKREDAIRNAIKISIKEDSPESLLKYADKEPSESAIFCDICQKIQSSEYGIVELTGLNANVLLEYGMMLALGKPVFVIVKKGSEEEVKSKLPSNIDWKRAITYQETYDIMTGLITQLETRSHLKAQPFVGEIILRKPLEENYPSIKKWYNQIGKKSISGSGVEQKKNSDRVIIFYCQYMKMDPDQIIEHATQEAKSASGIVKFHDDALENFLHSLTDSKPYQYWGVLRGFYKHNGIRITIHRPKYSVKQDYEKLTTEQLKGICDEGTLRSRSWILANSYIGLDVGKLVLLKVEDFHTEKWAETRRIYPVTIRADVSGTFGYTTFIGEDAKTVLQEFIKSKKLGQRDIVWKMVRTNFRTEFNRDRERAGVGKIMNQNVYARGEKRNFVSLTPKALGKRLEDILKEEIPLSDWTLVDYLLGRGIETNLPCSDDIEKAYLEALPKLTVYQTEIPPIKYRPPIHHSALKSNIAPFHQQTFK